MAHGRFVTYCWDTLFAHSRHCHSKPSTQKSTILSYFPSDPSSHYLLIKLCFEIEKSFTHNTPIMCVECDFNEDDLRCVWCGVTCFGKCDDPDSCPACWMPLGIDEPYGEWVGAPEFLNSCLGDNCRCNCRCNGHDDLYEELECRWQAGVSKTGDKSEEHLHCEGVFPFDATGARSEDEYL